MKIIFDRVKWTVRARNFLKFWPPGVKKCDSKSTMDEFWIMSHDKWVIDGYVLLLIHYYSVLLFRFARWSSPTSIFLLSNSKNFSHWLSSALFTTIFFIYHYFLPPLATIFCSWSPYQSKILLDPQTYYTTRRLHTALVRLSPHDLIHPNQNEKLAKIIIQLI